MDHFWDAWSEGAESGLFRASPSSLAVFGLVSACDMLRYWRLSDFLVFYVKVVLGSWDDSRAVSLEEY